MRKCKNPNYKRPKVPVEWNDEWFESQYALAKLLKCSTGRVNSCLKAGHKLRGHYVVNERVL